MCLCGTDRARETESGFSSQKGESGKCGKGWLRKTERRQRKEKELDQGWKKRTKMKRMERGRAGERTDRQTADGTGGQNNKGQGEVPAGVKQTRVGRGGRGERRT